MHTLVVADDEINQLEGMRDLIDWASMGFVVKAAISDGTELMDFISKNPVDVVLTDIQMQKVSGLDVAAYVRNHSPATIVVLISGYKEFEYARKALELGVTRYLVKPVLIEEFNEIFTTLGVELSKKKAQMKIDAQSQNWTQAESEGKIAQDTHIEGDIYQRDDIIRKACAYIADHYMDNISLNDVADHIFLNPVYFSRFFKQHTGKNFIDYLTELRIKEAIDRLAQGKYKIYEIGEQVGYSSTKYFTRVFKNITGYSPKEYQRRIIAGS